MTTAYLASEGYESQLERELEGIVCRYGRLFVTDRELQRTFWAQNIWLTPTIAHFSSISEAAHLLRAIQRDWALYSYTEHRRAKLIEGKLPSLSSRPLPFPPPLSFKAMGSWTLVSRHEILYSAKCSSPFQNGVPQFEANLEPPSRAYMKLWEGLAVMGRTPVSGERCLEIGASPGGWTWALAKLGVDLLSVDRSALAPSVSSLPNVTFKEANGFSMVPELVGKVDWIFSDVACYPAKLLDWVHLWLESGSCKNYFCTLKFQGVDNYAIAERFASLAGSRVQHLPSNKHELTWMASF